MEQLRKVTNWECRSNPRKRRLLARGAAGTTWPNTVVLTRIFRNRASFKEHERIIGPACVHITCLIFATTVGTLSEGSSTSVLVTAGTPFWTSPLINKNLKQLPPHIIQEKPFARGMGAAMSHQLGSKLWVKQFHVPLLEVLSRLQITRLPSGGLTLILGTQKWGFSCKVQRRPPCGHLLKWKLTPKNPLRTPCSWPPWLMFSREKSLKIFKVLKRTYETSTLTLKICILQWNEFKELTLVLFESLI
jgi:hypothetical protein